MAKLVSAAVAILAGIGGAVLVYWAPNAAVERLPRRWEQRLKPYAFIGPALLLSASSWCIRPCGPCS